MRISVIIPVRDEEDSISGLLDGLLNQTRLPDEIVLTDGGSIDGTVRIIEEYAKTSKVSIQLIREKAALPGRGRNVAASHSANEWLAFIDGGIRPEQDWLSRLSEKADSDKTIDVVYGSWVPVTNTLFKESAAIAYVPPPADRGGVLCRPRFIASSLMRRSVWQTVGGFPEQLRSAEDLIFMDRIQEAKFHTVFEPRAIVHWNVQPTLAKTFKRFVNYSSNNIQAGLWKQWQAAIFRRYGLLIVISLPMLLFKFGWVVILVLWLALLGSRSIVALYRNRNCYPAGPLRNFARFLVLLPLLATLDAAAIYGSLLWLVRDRFLFVNETANVGNRA